MSRSAATSSASDEKAPRPGPRRPGPHRRRRSLQQRLLLGSGLLLGGALLLGLAGLLYVVVKFLGIERIGNLETDDAAGGEPRNYLVVGSDQREGEPVEGQRSDTIMVVRVDPDEEELAVLSIPRDLMVPIAGTGRTDRINSAYSIGRETLIDTIRDAFGIELHHYVEIDFSSFEHLVDEAGGINIWTDAALKDEHSGLYVEELGCVELDGEQALAFVRSRHLQYLTPDGWSAPDPTADLGRIERQQVFMRRALAEAISRAKSNPTRIPDLVDAGVDAVAVDESLSVRDLLGLANRLRDFDPAGLHTYPLPVVERGDGATVAVDTEAAQPILDYFRTPDDRTSGASGEDGGSGTSAPGSGADADAGSPPSASGADAGAGSEPGAGSESSDEPAGEGSEAQQSEEESAEGGESAGSAPPTQSSNTGSNEFVVGEPPEGESCS